MIVKLASLAVAISGWLAKPAARAFERAETPAPGPTPLRHELAPMPAELHWDKTAAVISDAIERSTRAAELQEAAAAHLDSARYGLDHLLKELATAMKLPGAPEAAVVARIEPKALPERRRAQIAA